MDVGSPAAHLEHTPLASFHLLAPFSFRKGRVGFKIVAVS